MEYNFAQETVDIHAHLSSLLTLISVSATWPVSAAELLGATSLRQNQDANVTTTQTNHTQTPQGVRETQEDVSALQLADTWHFAQAEVTRIKTIPVSSLLLPR